MEAKARKIVLCTHRRAPQGVTVSGVFSPVRGSGRLFHRQTRDIRADLSGSAGASPRTSGHWGRSYWLLERVSDDEG
jgi:hypothetical protein